MLDKYVLSYFFEWGGPILWARNDKARDRFGNPADLADLPLSAETTHRAEEMVQWHDTALDWDDPAGPSPWEQEEKDRFKAAALELLETIRRELGDEFEVINDQPGITGDPERDYCV